MQLFVALAATLATVCTAQPLGAMEDPLNIPTPSQQIAQAQQRKSNEQTAKEAMLKEHAAEEMAKMREASQKNEQVQDFSEDEDDDDDDDGGRPDCPPDLICTERKKVRKVMVEEDPESQHPEVTRSGFNQHRRRTRRRRQQAFTPQESKQFTATTVTILKPTMLLPCCTPGEQAYWSTEKKMGVSIGDKGGFKQRMQSRRLLRRATVIHDEVKYTQNDPARAHEVLRRRLSPSGPPEGEHQVVVPQIQCRVCREQRDYGICFIAENHPRDCVQLCKDAITNGSFPNDPDFTGCLEAAQGRLVPSYGRNTTYLNNTVDEQELEPAPEMVLESMSASAVLPTASNPTLKPFANNMGEMGYAASASAVQELARQIQNNPSYMGTKMVDQGMQLEQAKE